MRLLNKNLTKAEKKTDLNVPNAIATKDKQIAEKLGLDDRIDVSAHTSRLLYNYESLILKNKCRM